MPKQQDLPGLHNVKVKRRDGTATVYHYAWRGGPRIEAEPGTRQFRAEFYRLTEGREQSQQTMADLIASYAGSPQFARLAEKTRKDYRRALDHISQRYFDLPIDLLSAKGMRAEFLEWRDTMADRPRTADFTMTVLARVLSWAKDREIIETNKAERIGRLARGSRKDIIWSDDDIAAFMAVAPKHLQDALMLALWTLQRQGDLLALEWPQISGNVLTVVQGKTGAKVRLLLPDALATWLDAMPRRNRKILTTRSGQEWTQDGFRASWARYAHKSGIAGRLTFHDLRGTGITALYRDGYDLRTIAMVSGHTEREAENVIRRNYLAVEL